LTPVKSSSIEAVAHDPAQKTMTVKFTSGGTYRYEGVTAAQHAELMRAGSVGTHFHKNILGKFTASKIA
jgi:KTSC domain